MGWLSGSDYTMQAGREICRPGGLLILVNRVGKEQQMDQI